MNTQQIFHGSNGSLWFDGELLDTVTKVEIKITGDFEDTEVCGDYATFYTYSGWKGEGSFSRKKSDAKVAKKVAEAYRTGEMPELTIVSRLTNAANSTRERWSISKIVVTEAMLASFEAKKGVEEEVPFKFSKFDLLEG